VSTQLSKAELLPLREALASCQESGFPGSGAVLIPRDCAVRLVDELLAARARIAELEAKLRAIETPAPAPTSDPFDFDLRTWDPGNHGTPGGVGQ
jgi:hypothetical protein